MMTPESTTNTNSPLRFALIKPGNCIREARLSLHLPVEGYLYDSGESVTGAAIKATQAAGAQLHVISRALQNAEETIAGMRFIEILAFAPSMSLLAQRFLKFWAELRILPRLSAFRPHLMVCIGPGYLLLIPWLYAIISGSTFVPLMVDSFSITYKKGFAARLHHAVTRLVLRSAKTRRILSYSHYIKSEIELEGISKEKTMVFSQVYEDRFFSPPSESSLTSNSAPPKILFVGRLDLQQKGLDFLIEIARSVVPAHPDVVFEIIGEGSDRQTLEELIAQNHLQANFQILGYRPQEQLLIHMQAAHLMVIPSRHEGLAKVGLEAVLASLPLVAFDCGGVRDYLRDQHNGFLIPRFDTALFARRVVDLLEDASLRRTMQQNAWQVANEFRQPQYPLADAFRDLLTQQTGS